MVVVVVLVVLVVVAVAVAVAVVVDTTIPKTLNMDTGYFELRILHFKVLLVRYDFVDTVDGRNPGMYKTL